ncbi:hypothetical protein [Mesoterricola silvestris]|uniref:Uncharacterized protein n=1 Tax=Mesoterricola silvestris TaxID=2927979 RepID=A0AA48H5Q7_9BACT|nr:hypothetical protein [Mesoterricola silvestris]BDU72348.1 hypothetical protein METEAL_15220 [Mesoterricola silvestris]
MESNLAHCLPEGQPENFEESRIKRFKRRLNQETVLCGRERKAIATDMQCSQSSLSIWLDHGRGSMPVHWLPEWTREVGPGLLSWIAKENGYSLVQETAGEPVPVMDAGQLMALIALHHGKAMAGMIQAREDGVITEQEKRDVFPDLQRLIRELEAQAENFRPGGGDL